MKTFAIDTTTNTATAAIIEDGLLLGEVSVNMNKPHSQKIMPISQMLFEQTGLKPCDIDLFSACVGPGSFTGIRIGIAAVLGFADALGKETIGVSTLEALKVPFESFDSLVCPLVDAKRNKVYYALYNNEETLVKQSCDDISAVLDKLKNYNKKIIFTGDFVVKNKEAVKSALGEFAVFVPDAFCNSNATSVAVLAERKYQKGEKEKISPDYVLKSYVEELDK